MNEFIIEKPVIDKPYKAPFSYTKNDIDRMNRKRKRAAELGIKLFILDSEESNDRLKELEDLIIDDYIDMDKDVPEELKKEYLELKKAFEQKNNDSSIGSNDGLNN